MIYLWDLLHRVHETVHVKGLANMEHVIRPLSTVVVITTIIVWLWVPQLVGIFLNILDKNSLLGGKSLLIAKANKLLRQKRWHLIRISGGSEIQKGVPVKFPKALSSLQLLRLKSISSLA